MVVTPEQLSNWIKSGKKIIAVDLRSSQLQKTDPLLGLQAIMANTNVIPKTRDNLILICQYGIVTEGLILEKKLTNTYSLLGGSEAWNHFYESNLDFSQYSRQVVLPEIGIEGQNKIKNSSIAIIGMGGLGCPAAQSLVASGVGHLKIIDNDKIEITNLHRQPLYDQNDLGSLKVAVSKRKLEKLNENIVIETFNCFFDKSNAIDILKNTDIVIDATDNYRSRAIIDNASKKLGIPMIYGGVYRFEGHISVFNYNEGPSFKEIFPDSNEKENDCDTAGILGMLPSIIGNIQALEAIKIIVGIDNNLSGKLLIYNILTHQITKIEL